jgi:hypothetical protein
MVTEIGFVSLLVAAFGLLAGALVFLGVRVGAVPAGSDDRGEHNRGVGA